MPTGLALLAGSLMLFGCQSRQIDATLLAGPDDEVSFSEDVLPIFTRSCAPCHVGDRTSGVSLGSYQQVTTSVGEQYERRIVAAGTDGVVPLLDKIGPAPRFGERMPLGQAPLAADQIATVRAWIEAGAPDN